MAKVTGIDIGSSSIKLVEIEGSPRKWRVQRVISLPRSVPHEAEDDTPPPDERELLLSDLKAALHESGVTKERSFLAVSAAPCVLRTMTLPFKGKEEIRKVLKFEAEGYIHSHPIDDVVVDAVTIAERKDGTELFLVACPKETLGSELKILQKAGCDPEFADLGAALLVEAADELGAFEVVLADGEEAQSRPEAQPGELQPVDLVLDLGATSVQLIVVRGGALQTVRCLRWGLGRFMTIDSTGIARADETKSGELAERILREAQRYLSGLGLDGGARRIFVSGGGARWPGLPEAIAATSGTTVEILDLLLRAGSTEGEGGDCDVALAAAVAGLNPARRTFNFRQEEVAFRPKFDRLKVPIAFAMLIATVLLAGLAWAKFQKITRIEQQIGVIQPVEEGKRTPKFPSYNGLVYPLLQPAPGARIKGYLRPEHAEKVLSAAAKATTESRTAVVKNELRKIYEDLQERTGVYSDLPSESGLSILQRFSEIVDRASKNERVGRFMIVSIDLQIGATSRSAGRFRFEVAFRGQNYIDQNAAFNKIVQDATLEFTKDSPFAKAVYRDEEPFQSSLDPGGQFTYELDLVNEIPVLQNEVPAR
ncbi:MAG: pilus assembly protein PilM [Planctomycetes bacterium]|nr:pilus assembly protein PilM [Planctomycetota bacterium]